MATATRHAIAVTAKRRCLELPRSSIGVSSLLGTMLWLGRLLFVSVGPTGMSIVEPHQGVFVLQFSSLLDWLPVEQINFDYKGLLRVRWNTKKREGRERAGQTVMHGKEQGPSTRSVLGNTRAIRALKVHFTR